MEVGSLLLPHGSLESNSDCQALGQAPFSTEAFRNLLSIFPALRM